MTFLSERKQEIINDSYKNACCRRALLSGVIFAKGEADSDEISIRLENKGNAEFVCLLVREFYGREALVSAPGENGGRYVRVTFNSKSCRKYIEGLDTDGEPSYFQNKCSTCREAFLRGVFLSSGRMTDPKKQYRLELAPSNRLNELRDYLSGLGLSFSTGKRREETILYSANSVTVEDFFVDIGMNATAFEIMNSKIVNDFKNSANRIRNCETNNIEKTVSAALKWIVAIEKLESANLLSMLPEELEKTARLRLRFRDYSLARLAAEFTPPISKPGLSHRLNKILEISESLLNSKK